MKYKHGQGSQVCAPTLSQEQARQRAEIALQTAAFLATGGTVTRLDVAGRVL